MTTLKITVEVNVDKDKNKTTYNISGECTDFYGVIHTSSSDVGTHTPTMIERNVAANVGNIIEKALGVNSASWRRD